ncbi:hypothetical protein TELCIR_00692 [Teladorsagia circumcincta]|uniref:Uncharacterized protein n=1 Tax=Teladorsagia circumcincta TaxID=45464 RepID=A0A2G9V443_TELCI|nr:hypothetical protein TELCIR_00692 [Teladorsagia circumcincta]
MLTSTRYDPRLVKTVSWPSRCPSRNQPSPPEALRSRRLSINTEYGLLSRFRCCLSCLLLLIKRQMHIVFYDTAILYICLYNCKYVN